MLVLYFNYIRLFNLDTLSDIKCDYHHHDQHYNQQQNTESETAPSFGHAIKLFFPIYLSIAERYQAGNVCQFVVLPVSVYVQVVSCVLPYAYFYPQAASSHLFLYI